LLTANFVSDLERADACRSANVLVENHFEMVGLEAGRLKSRVPHHVSLQDLMQAGYMGLLEAAHKYKPERGPFRPYAKGLIQGRMLDWLRAEDPTPRRVRQKRRVIEYARDRLSLRLGREPSAGETAEAIGLTPEAFATLVWSAQGNVLEPLNGGGTSRHADGSSEGTGALFDEVLPSDIKTPEEACLRRELGSLLRREVRRLPPREVVAVRMRFLEGRRLREIGAELGMTESGACQVVQRGVAHLRLRLRRDLALPSSETSN
jgi:RNA polymerase sigma factor for flagellar operon FliA